MSTDEEQLLDDALTAFEALSGDPEMLDAYRSEIREIEAGFEPLTPAW